ncbi:MAG: hypothetical protein EHM93_02215 [Bacteroidales bacterium]|nr:MAG: hypothetical protein EHM93_02215 [Bacteroidales bacterium]
MKTKLRIFSALSSMVILFVFVNCSKDSNTDEVQLTGAYFNKTFPTTTVTRFAPELFTAELHAPPIFSPNGEEVFYSLMESRGLKYRKIENGVWSSIANAPFNSSEWGDSPFLSSDGSKLLFMSAYNSTDEKIWICTKSNGVWSAPQMLGNEVNQNSSHWQSSMADNQNLYFASGGDIYYSKYENGNYIAAQKLGLAINTASANDYEGSPFIARDESFLIFDRAINFTDANLFISIKQLDGSWSTAVPITELNTVGGNDLYANVSPDGRFIMFLSSRNGTLLPYWVDASILNHYKNS